MTLLAMTGNMDAVASGTFKGTSAIYSGNVVFFAIPFALCFIIGVFLTVRAGWCVAKEQPLANSEPH